MLAVVTRHSRGVTLDVALGLMGAALGFVGVSRLQAHLIIRWDRIEWTWFFSHHSIPLSELVDVAFVEAGDSAFESVESELGRAFLGPVGYWITGVSRLFTHVGPTLGPQSLFLLKRYGPPVRIHAIGVSADPTRNTDAVLAFHALKGVIEHHHDTKLMSPRELSLRHAKLRLRRRRSSGRQNS
jgi:hypothetical protein